MRCKFLDHPKQEREKMQMFKVGLFLEIFKKDCGYYPHTSEGLDFLKHNVRGSSCWKGPYIDEPPSTVPIRGGRYYYISEGVEYMIYHYGADNTKGGMGDDEDIYVTSFDVREKISSSEKK